MPIDCTFMCEVFGCIHPHALRKKAKESSMKNKIYFIRISIVDACECMVEFVLNKGKTRIYHSPSDDSLYRLLNNSMISDINPFQENDGMRLEIFPKY